MSAPRTVVLGDVAGFIRGITFKPDDVVPLGSPGSISCMRTKNVQAEIDLEDVWAVPEQFVNRTDLILQEGDLLVSTANSSNIVGKGCWVPELPWKATLGGFISALRPNRSRVDPRYLFHWYTTPRIQAEVRACGRKTTNISNLDLDRVLRLPFPELPLPEQRRIAAILDQAEALRAIRRAALAKLDTLSQSIFIEMFGDPDNKLWPMSTIAEVAHPSDGSIRTGPFGSQLLHSEFTDKGIAVLGIDNAVANEFQWGERRFISESKYRELKRYTVKPGDVLITIMGTCGRCAVVPEGIPTAINTKHLCCITLDQTKCLPHFLHAFFLRHPMARNHLEQTAKGAIMAGLNMGLIKSMPICIPPLELQQKFAKRQSVLEEVKITSRVSLKHIDNLFSSLQHRAFRGEL